MSDRGELVSAHTVEPSPPRHQPHSISLQPTYPFSVHLHNHVPPCPHSSIAWAQAPHLRLPAEQRRRRVSPPRSNSRYSLRRNDQPTTGFLRAIRTLSNRSMDHMLRPVEVYLPMDARIQVWDRVLRRRRCLHEASRVVIKMTLMALRDNKLCITKRRQDIPGKRQSTVPEATEAECECPHRPGDHDHAKTCVNGSLDTAYPPARPTPSP